MTTTGSPEHNTVPTPEGSRADVEAFIDSIDHVKFEALRAQQEQVRANAEREALENGASTEDARAFAERAAEDVSTEFLVNILQSDIGREKSAIVETLIDIYSGTKMSSEEWYIGTVDDDGRARASGSARYAIALEHIREYLSPQDGGLDDIHGALLDGDRDAGDVREGEHNPYDGLTPQEEREQRYEDLDGLRSLLASLSAKRQGNLAGKGGEFYARVLKEYNESVVALCRLELTESPDLPSLSEEDRNKLAIEFFLEQQNLLREDTVEALKKTKVGAFIEWMTSGSTAKRIGKGLLIGGGAAGLGFIFGGVAAGAVVGAGLVAAGRFARGYAVAEALGNGPEKSRGLKALTDKHLGEALDTHAEGDEDTVDRYARYFDDQFEKDTKKQQRKRIGSFAVGLAAVGVGAGLFTATHIAIDAADASADLANKPGVDKMPSLTDVSNAPGANLAGHEYVPEGSDVTLGGAEVVDAPLTSPESIDAYSLATSYEGEVGNADGSTTPESLAQVSGLESAVNGSEASSGLNINVGLFQGGIEAFQNAGLTEAQWYQVAPGLAENFPDTFEMKGADVRIRTPGPLPDDVQVYIKKSLGL